MNGIALLTAFGFGSVLTAFVQALLGHLSRRRERGFDERKEAYIGLLEAYHRAATERTDAAGKQFAYWQMRCELVAPAVVRSAITRIVETNDDRPAREAAHEDLKAALRRDIGIAK